MKTAVAKKLWRNLSHQDILTEFDGVILNDGTRRPSGFHQWADGKPTLGIARLCDRQTSTTLHFVVTDWKIRNEYYLVLYPENRTTPYVELWRTITDETGITSLSWRYAPSKRDGKNDPRKNYFARHFASTDVIIDLPRTLSGTTGFIQECFTLVENRLKADRLATKRPISRNSFPEGREHERLHTYRERSATVVKQAKDSFKHAHGRFYCEVCGFDFVKHYGALGSDFIEAHHLVPVSQLETGAKTRPEDLVLVCPNCHRMIHRKRPWLPRKKLKSILRNAGPTKPCAHTK